MVYEKIDKFIVTAGISRSTLYRFYKKNDEFWSETKIKSGRRLIPTTHAKYFDSEALFDELKTAKLENKSLRNLITYLADKETLCRTLELVPAGTGKAFDALGAPAANTIIEGGAIATDGALDELEQSQVGPYRP